ncbi:MAG: energy-coupling factor ABC transporter ATP-binding protein [Deltaproteobacteria bacterium]|jgi:biotin transport system ATP-binding protein|nr:energy-coupling factor ABC transporter ATP-binding protein [Deltaproteobacteria bacterium]
MIVDARSICLRHHRAQEDTLKNLDLIVRPGELVGLVGINGSGKSTLLTVLAGLLPTTGGALSVLGFSLPKERAKLTGQVALVPQNPDVYILGALVGEDLLLGVSSKDVATKARAMDVATDMGLADLLDKPVQHLSYGQKRKLCLASTLALEPKLLLLDEPMAGLDFPASIAVRDILARNKANGLTQIVVSHDLDLTADLTDTFVLLVGGAIEAKGEANEVFPYLSKAGVRPPCWWYTGGGPVWLSER